MGHDSLRKWVGGILVIIPLLINVPFGILIADFDYPDILRESTGVVLTRFHEGGVPLILTWWSFAIIGTPLLFAIIGLYQLMKDDGMPYLLAATVFGVASGFTQMIGLLRWTFVVPHLAGIYTDPLSSQTTREAVEVVFQAVHQYGGVVIGEHLGQLFTIVWMVLVSLAMMKSRSFRPWLGWFGLISALVYLTAQLELAQTVMPDTPVIPDSGLIGSLLWLAWLILTGASLLRHRTVSS